MFVDLSKKFEKVMSDLGINEDVTDAQFKEQMEERLKKQKKANAIKAEESGSPTDIVKTLPILLPDQQKDVLLYRVSYWTV